jgi:hypothetical protein
LEDRFVFHDGRLTRALPTPHEIEELENFFFFFNKKEKKKEKEKRFDIKEDHQLTTPLLKALAHRRL